MEIINDPTYPDGPGSNDMAIRFLDQVWNEGIRVFGVGGSDSHNLEDEFYEGASFRLRWEIPQHGYFVTD